jgi:O-succinylbenzoate synthase
VKIDGVEIRRICMPLKAPFETSFGVQNARELILLRVVTTDGEGWGECVTMGDPLYSSEFNAAAGLVLRQYLIPALMAAEGPTAARVGTLLERFKGHRMAKGALEMAVLDAELRSAGMRFADYLGADKERVSAGVSVGIEPTIADLLHRVSDFIDQGYVRIKLKIKPGWDIEPVRAVRERFGDDLLLQVDANTAYTLADARHLARLDDFDLLLIEQPLGDEDLTDHAELAKLIRTPVCLDESIVSAKAAADAISLGACAVINIKAGRVGGYLEARRVHDVAAAHGIPVWCGGMLETGLGRAANIALAALPGFVLPGDTSASDRFYQQDITTPVTLHDGQVIVPSGPGLGVAPIPEILDEVTISTEWISA